MEQQAPLLIPAAPEDTNGAVVHGRNDLEQGYEDMHPAVEWYVHEQNEHQAVVRVYLPEGDDIDVKQEKTEDVKEEPTVVAVQVPEEEDFITLPPKPLEAGEIPFLYDTVEARKELLDERVHSSSIHNQGLRFDILSTSAQNFIDGKIEGFFHTHLLNAMYAEVRAVNKRTARRRTRRQKKDNKRLKGGISKNQGNNNEHSNRPNASSKRSNKA